MIPAPLEYLANQPLGVSFLVDVGHVNEVDAEINGLRDDGLADIIAGTTAEGAAEADGGDFDAGGTEATVVHDCCCLAAPRHGPPNAPPLRPG